MNRRGGKSKLRRSGERGQTIILVAVSLVSLLAMAALAIDVVTLYVARGEMQRAADAAALAGAKAFVDSGVTSDPANAARQALSQTMATTVINSILPQNKISGAPPILAGAPAFDFTRPGNPQISVTLQRTDLPTFFSRIWGARLSTVSASAVAEAYNPGNAPANYPPIAPKCVKPMLVANQDPKVRDPFATGQSGNRSAGGGGRDWRAGNAQAVYRGLRAGGGRAAIPAGAGHRQRHESVSRDLRSAGLGL